MTLSGNPVVGQARGQDTEAGTSNDFNAQDKDANNAKSSAEPELIIRFGALGRGPQLPSRVAAAIAGEIAEGRLREGDRLPTEQALAGRFGVSRNVVREAIAKLRSDGVVQSRQGVGAFVISRAATATLHIDAELMSDRQVFRHVFELRAILEIRAAGMAGRRASEAQVAILGGALEQMRHAKCWADDGVTADLEFHHAVALATGNPYIAMMVGFLTQQMRQSIMFMRQNQDDFANSMFGTNIAEHAAIYEAVRARLPDGARDAMRRHITNAAQRLGYDLGEGASLSDDGFDP